jgi:hypothetical protein
MKLFIYQYTVHRPSAAPRLGIGAFGKLDVRLLGSHFGGELTFDFLVNVTCLYDLKRGIKKKGRTCSWNFMKGWGMGCPRCCLVG